MINRRSLLIAAAAAVPMTAWASTQTVASFLAQQGDANVFAAIHRAAATHSGWLLFARQFMTPAEILPACERLALPTVGDVGRFVDAAGNALSYAQVDALTRCTAPAPFTQSALPTIGVADMHQNVIARQIALTPDHLARPSDALKHLPTEQQFDQLLAAFPYGVPDMDFKYGLRECEEYAQAFLGWLARIGLGSLAVGQAFLRMYANGVELPSGHITVIGVTQARVGWFLDPMDRKRYPLSHVAFRGFAGQWRDGWLEVKATEAKLQTLIL